MSREQTKALDQLELTEYAAREYLGVNTWARLDLTGGAGVGGAAWILRFFSAGLVMAGVITAMLGAGVVGGLAAILGAAGWVLAPKVLPPRRWTERDRALAADLERLRQAIARHNRLVERLRHLERLKEIGNEVSLANREEAIEVLRRNRETYVRGLKTVRLLSQSQHSADDLSDLHVILDAAPSTLEAEVADYAGIVDASLAGHMRVRRSMTPEAEVSEGPSRVVEGG